VPTEEEEEEEEEDEDEEEEEEGNLLKQLLSAPTVHSQVAMLSDDTHANQ